jgi:autotransporter-associated beta strand protein
MHVARALRSWVGAALLALAGPLLPVALVAQDATWLPNPGSQDFNTDSNWSTGTVPSGATAFFSISAVTNLKTSLDTSVLGLTLNAGASDYRLTNSHKFEITGPGIVIDGGSLRLTNKGTLLFSGSSTASSVLIVNTFDGVVTFADASSAGAATIRNSGEIDFAGSSSAGSAIIRNWGGLYFTDTSTAGTATIFNNCCLIFSGNSSAGSATIINRNNLEFLDSSSAANATIRNKGDITFENTSTAGSASIRNAFFGAITFFDSSTAGNAIITNNGTIAFLDNSTAGSAAITNNYFGAIGFEGSSTAGNAAIINGGGLFFLDNSSAGNATITNNAGLVFGGSSTAGTATIFNNCCLTFFSSSTAGNATIVTENGGHTFFLDNASGGAARFVLNGGGVLDISGLSTAGTTAGSIEGAGNISLGDKQLTIGSLNTSTVFSGVIDGAGGSLVKVGSGSLTLSGASTYTGPTTVVAGILVVNGSLVSDVTVNAGASLMGIGQVGALTIASGAVHSPGNSIGTQTVNGNYVNSGTLVIEANAAGQSDRVVVNGNVNISGAMLKVVDLPGTYGPTTRYVIIQNNGANPVVGNFAGISNGLAFLTPSVITNGGDGNDVVLTLTRNDASLASVAQTINQRAVALALANGFASDAGSPGAVIINSLLMLSAEGARNAFDLMSGEIHASLAHVFFGQSRHLTSLASERLWDLAPYGGVSAASQDGWMMKLGATPGDAHERMGLGIAPREDGEPRNSRVATWVRGYGDIGSIDADGNAARLESRTAGFIAGGDATVAPGILVGVMGGWGTSQADVDQRLSSAEIDSNHVGVYARATFGDVIVKAIGTYSHHEMDVTRHIAFASLSSTAHSSYGADQATLYGEAGWRLQLGSFGLMPLAGLRWSRVHVDHFAEDGAGVLDLISDGAAYSMLDAIAGIRIATSFAGAGLTWVPQARAAWTRSFGDVDPRLDLVFAGGGSLLISGVTRGPDTFTLGAGLNVYRSEGAFGFLDYAANLADGSRDHAVTTGVRIRF